MRPLAESLATARVEDFNSVRSSRSAARRRATFSRNDDVLDLLPNFSDRQLPVHCVRHLTPDCPRAQRLSHKIRQAGASGRCQRTATSNTWATVESPQHLQQVTDMYGVVL